MSHPDALDAHFALANRYAEAFAAYRKRGVDQTLDPNDKEWPDNDPGRVEHYFRVGADALRLIVASLLAHLREPPRRILDFASGSGRVTRHLSALFPDAEIWVCDIAQAHIDFCAKQFGAKPKKSQDNLRELAFETDFDLVFCGSLLTHLSMEGALGALGAIIRALSPTGIALVTLQGRHSMFIQRHRWKYIEDKLFAIAERDAQRAGFGFVDYEGEFRARFPNRTPYGIALVRPSWITRHIEMSPVVRLLGYTERAWDGHQDLLVFGRPPVNDR